MLDRVRFILAGSARSLGASPVPVGAAIITLAVAGGVNAAMFGLIDRALLGGPAGVADVARLHTVTFQPPGDPAGTARMTTTSYVAFREIHDGVPALTSAAFQRAPGTVMLDGEQRRVNAMLVSGEYFAVLGASARAGRTLQGRDDDQGAATAVVSHAFWRSALQSDAAVLGRTLELRGERYEIVGVMPPGFSGHSATAVDLWLPMAAAMRGTPGWDRDPYRNIVSVIARLGPAATIAEADTQLSELTGRRASLAPVIGAEVNAADRRVAWWIAAVSVLVLVIGLANVATLLLVRAARTRAAVVVRATLGASPARLRAEAAADALLVSGAAAAVSAVLASWMDEAVRGVLFPGLAPAEAWNAAALRAQAVVCVLGFAVALAATASTLPVAGHVPGTAGDGRRRVRAQRLLLMVQTAASVLLLAGAGLFGGSLYRLWSQDFGMRMDDVLVVDFELGPERIADQDALFRRALDEVRALPGVELATPIDAIPFSGFHVPPISVPGRQEPPAVGRQLPFLTAVTPEFLRILGITVVDGRALTEADERGGLVVMVNQSMARAVWPGESAIGKCIRAGFDPDFDPSTAMGPPVPSDAVPCREVVGVFRDLRQRSVLPMDNEDRLMQYFVPFSQVPFPPFAQDVNRIRGVMLRAPGDAAALAGAVRRAVVGARTDLPFVRVRPYTELLERQMRPWTMGTRLLALFSALALGVAAIGLYAAFAHAVAERRRELAIRLAVGAAPADVRRMIVREALAIAAAGAVAGSAAAAGAGRWLQSLLFEMTPADPLVLGAAAVAMIAVALLAVARPACAAAAADPAALLAADHTRLP